METISEELKAFKEHFLQKTGVNKRNITTLEESHLPHLKRISLGKIDVRDMRKVADYIEETFSEEGTFNHVIPKVVPYNGDIYLTIPDAYIRKFIMAPQT